MINIKSFVCNEMGVNALLLYENNGQCVIVDPGCWDEGPCNVLKDFINKGSLNPVCVINTHGHFDHIAGNAFIKNEFNCPVWIHRDDLFLLERAEEIAGMFGFQIRKPPYPDRFLTENDTIELGGSVIRIILVPGHSPGSICLYSESDKLLICGDVLFNGGIGRTDLFGGDYGTLVSGIRNKLLVLPRDTVVYPGHGPVTTIGQEHDTNPFLK
ncbi:MAG: MBL fold metallo-hydrolase [Bacteroidales bacterium]|nr:MBL fold metallo-hydrolase [Bacteroidales bacterium]